MKAGPGAGPVFDWKGSGASWGIGCAIVAVIVAYFAWFGVVGD